MRHSPVVVKKQISWGAAALRPYIYQVSFAVP